MTKLDTHSCSLLLERSNAVRGPVKLDMYMQGIGRWRDMVSAYLLGECDRTLASQAMGRYSMRRLLPDHCGAQAWDHPCSQPASPAA